MNEAPVILPVSLLRDFATDLLKNGGYTAEEAALTAQSLVLSNLTGHDSHGIIRVAEYLHFLKHGSVVSGAPLKILQETKATLQADAGYGLGQTQMPHLIDLLLPKAKECGTATAAMKNCGHAGRLGEWVEIIAHAGMAGMVMVNDNGTLQLVAPPGGIEGRTSTNPVAFGIPLPEGDAFAVDFSTSAAAIGKIRLARISGEKCTEGLFQDAQGTPATDPAIMFEEPTGTLLPMGGAQGYKGFALSMVVDCLTAGLSGGFVPPAPADAKLANNVFVTMWNPDCFAGLSHLQEQAACYGDYVRATLPRDPAIPVRVPGDRAKAERKKREREGIPLSLGACRTLLKSASITGTTPPDALLKISEKN